MSYRVHGLVVASPLALPLGEIEDGSVDFRYRVGPDSAALPPVVHHRTDDPDDPWVVERWHGDRLLVEFPGCATFEVGRDDVVLVADQSSDPDLVVHLLLDHVLPGQLTLSGVIGSARAGRGRVRFGRA